MWHRAGLDSYARSPSGPVFHFPPRLRRAARSIRPTTHTFGATITTGQTRPPFVSAWAGGSGGGSRRQTKGSPPPPRPPRAFATFGRGFLSRLFVNCPGFSWYPNFLRFGRRQSTVQCKFLDTGPVTLQCKHMSATRRGLLVACAPTFSFSGTGHDHCSLPQERLHCVSDESP